MALANDNTMVNIGKFSGAVGLKGEVRVTLYARDSENLHEDSVLHVEGPKGEETYEVRAVRYQKGKPVIRLDRISDRDGAEALNGLEIYISEDDLLPLPEGQYYFREIIGLRVYDRTSGQEIGVVTDIMENPAHNIYIVRREGSGPDASAADREIMIPAVDAFIREIDPDRGVMEVELIEGML